MSSPSPPRQLDSESDGSPIAKSSYTSLVSRSGKEVWRRSGLNSLWRAESNPTTSKPSEETAALVNQKLRSQPLDTSSILYPTLTLHPAPTPNHILVMSISHIAQSPSTISNEGSFDILMRRLEPWVGEEGEGGYVLIVFAAEGGETYGYNKNQEVRKLPGVAWWLWKYKRIPRKYRKNLKRLVALLPFIIPFLSPKSYSKLHPLTSILSLHYTYGVPLKGIDITIPVLEAEAKILREQPDLVPASSRTAFNRPAPPRLSSDTSFTSWGYHGLTSAVGTAASYLSFSSTSSTSSDEMSKHPHEASGYWHRDLAQLVEECGGQVPPLLVDLRKVILGECSSTKGIFRRAPSTIISTPVEALLGISLDAQPNIPWTDIAKQDPLFPPKILGRFLSELRSPVVHADLYSLIREIKRPEEIKSTFLPALLPPYGLVLSYIIHMFHHLSAYETQTHMSAFNYATVLAPSLIAGPSPIDDAEMCLEPGKTLPDAMKKAMGAVSKRDDKGGSGTLVGLLEMWMRDWTVVSGSSVDGESADQAKGQAQPRLCRCSWSSSTHTTNSTSASDLGTPATAPAPAPASPR